MKLIPYTIIIIHDNRLKKKYACCQIIVTLSSPKTGSQFAAKLAFGVQIRDRVQGQINNHAKNKELLEGKITLDRE